LQERQIARRERNQKEASYAQKDLY
jgi:hypothetical protein